MNITISSNAVLAVSLPSEEQIDKLTREWFRWTDEKKKELDEMKRRIEWLLKQARQ